MFHDIIECLIAALEAKDEYTCGHSNRVADLSYELAVALKLQGNALEELHMAAHLHDIGKIGISENILNKKGKLLLSEWEEIKRHSAIGHDILKKSHELKNIAEIVLHHHERWNGEGYPAGLRKKAIPYGSRIIAIPDAIDAMMSTRPYRKAFSWEECISEIMRNSGVQFDPEIVAEASSLFPKWSLYYLDYRKKQKAENINKYTQPISVFH